MDCTTAALRFALSRKLDRELHHRGHQVTYPLASMKTRSNWRLTELFPPCFEHLRRQAIFDHQHCFPSLHRQQATKVLRPYLRFHQLTPCH